MTRSGCSGAALQISKSQSLEGLPGGMSISRDLQFEVAEVLEEARDQRRDQQPTVTRINHQPQLSGAFGRGRKPGPHRVNLGDQALAMRTQQQACAGQCDAAGGAREQACAEASFKAYDGATDSHFGDAQYAGSGGKGLQIRRRARMQPFPMPATYCFSCSSSDPR